MPRNIWLAAIGIAALVAAAAPAHADDWSKTYSLTGRPQLMVDAGDGGVTITSHPDNRIDAHVMVEGWKLGRDVQVEESQTGNSVEIHIRVPREWFNFGMFGNRHRIEVTLAVPRDSDLDIHTGDGSISADIVSGHIRLDSGDGSINAQNLSGDLAMHSGDGSITASSLDGALDASSGDGRIDVAGRFDALRMHSGDGSITAAAASGSKISTDWSLRTGDGSIRLRLPDHFGADLDAHTGDGSITLDFPVTVSGSLNRSSVRGKIGGGGMPLVLRSGDGSIHIEKL